MAISKFATPVALTGLLAVLTTVTLLVGASFHPHMDQPLKHPHVHRSLKAELSLPFPECTILNGMDFVGNDIGSASAPRAEDCCGICHMNAQCKAFSWTNQSGGTCYLKSSRGQIVNNPNVHSGHVYDDRPPTCNILKYTDFTGNDIGNVPSPNAGGCCDKCRHFNGCQAFSYTNYNGGTCWLKSAKGATVYNPNVQSSDILDDGRPCNLEYGVDFVGNDLTSRPAARPTDCCGICWDISDCRAFTWSNYLGGMCWLKSAKGTTSHHNGNLVSAVVRPNPECAIQYNVDFINHDIGNKPSEDASGCCPICRSYSGCKAFSWSNHNGGTCWLKSAKGTTKSKPSVHSAVV